jgi:mannose-6-phosphate isomerase-like protein (cupin superfamily)
MYVIDLLHAYAATAEWPKPVRLPQKIFRIDTYLPRDAYHFARKDVPLEPPVLEHSHDFFELLMVEQGAVHHWINGLEERLEAGTLVFIRPSDRHALQSVPGSAARILNVMFRADTAAHLAERYGADVRRPLLLVRPVAADDAPPRRAAAGARDQFHAVA